MIIRTINHTDKELVKSVKDALTDEQIHLRLEKQFANKAVWLGAELDGRLVGFVYLKWEGKPTAPDFPDLEDLYVKPDQRRQGVALALVQEAEKLSKRKGFSKIGLAVNPDKRELVHRMYQKWGYKNTGSTPYVDGIYDGVEDWVIDLVKEL